MNSKTLFIFLIHSASPKDRKIRLERYFEIVDRWLYWIFHEELNDRALERERT